VFKKLILHYPADALEKIEEVSYLLKHQQANGGLKVEDFLQLEEIHNYSNVAQGVQAYIDKMQGGNKKVRLRCLLYPLETSSRRRRCRRRGRR